MLGKVLVKGIQKISGLDSQSKFQMFTLRVQPVIFPVVLSLITIIKVLSGT